MLTAVADTLSSLQAPGTFAVRRTCDASALHVEVKGVGRVPLPVSPTMAKKLCQVARKAPFGLRDKTLIDARIRDTWQIAKSRVKIERRRWTRMLASELEAIARELGLSGEGTLSAELYKMLVYEPGQFFVPHQDSEKTDDMVGTLLVELPSQYRGGSLVIAHRDQRMTFRRTGHANKKLTLVAFYADCHHEVKPIKSGYRVVLVFNLRFRGNGTLVTLPSGTVDALAEAVEAYFSTRLPPNQYNGEDGGLPSRMVYLLDHDYTEKSLGWQRLKNGDRMRAGALLEVAKRQDCVIFLTLADVHESWQCVDEWDGDRYGYGRAYGRYGGDDDLDEDDDDESDSGPELEDLIDSNVALCHWLGEDGEVVADIGSSYVDPDELCFTVPSAELDPFRSEHEGWMGNSGNTIDRWYHRAALVLWPRANDFAVRAKVAPVWALDQLLMKFANAEQPLAVRQVRSMLSFWSRTVRSDDRPEVFSKSLRVALQVNDAELAAAFLAPFRISSLSVAMAPSLVGLLTLYGLDWMKALFLSWKDRRFGSDVALSAVLVGYCKVLCKHRQAEATELAQWLVEREVCIVLGSYNTQLSDSGRSRLRYGGEGKGVPELVEHLGCTFEAAAISSAAEARNRLIDTLTSAERPAPILVLGDLLRRLRKKRRPNTVRALALGPIYHHLRGMVKSISKHPARAEDDWSIEAPQHCKGTDCAELTVFLRDPKCASLDWPLAKARRQHIHQAIDRFHLPVSHATHRQGSPYTLMLRKLPVLFEREARRRARQLALLKWLVKQRAAFVSAGP